MHVENTKTEIKIAMINDVINWFTNNEEQVVENLMLLHTHRFAEWKVKILSKKEDKISRLRYPVTQLCKKCWKLEHFSIWFAIFGAVYDKNLLPNHEIRSN